MDLLVSPSFFVWCESTPLSIWINTSVWAPLVIASMHWIALAMLMTDVAALDLRILGWIRLEQSVGEVNSAIRPRIRMSLAAAVVSGGAYFMSQAVQCGHSLAFLATAVLFLSATWAHVTIVRRATGAQELAPVGYRKFAAYLSLLSWVAVALAERGFTSLR